MKTEIKFTPPVWADKRLQEAYCLIQSVADDHNNPETDAYNSLYQALNCVEEADCDIEKGI